MVLDTSLLNTQYYKVHIKGRVEQSGGRSSTPLHFGVVAIEKGTFESPSTTVANFTLLYLAANKVNGLQKDLGNCNPFKPNY